jgi:hypothetical protein
MTSPLRGPNSTEGGGCAAAHLRARRARYGAAPPAPRVLRIALRATALRAALDPGDHCGPWDQEQRAGPGLPPPCARPANPGGGGRGRAPGTGLLRYGEAGHAGAATSARIRWPTPVRGTRRPPAGSSAPQRPAHNVRVECSGQCMTGDDHPGTAIPLEAAHRSQPGLQAPMVSLNPVVGVPIGAMPRRRQQLVHHDRVGRRLIGHHLDGSDPGRADGPLEEPAGRPDVAPPGDEHVNDLAELVDRPVHVAPLAGDLHIGLVDLPAISNTVAARPSSLGQQRCEPLHPAIDGDVVDLDTPFGEQLLDVAVGKAKAQVPVDRDDDDIGWEPEASEVRPLHRSRARTTRSHAAQSRCSTAVAANETAPTPPTQPSTQPTKLNTKANISRWTVQAVM